MDLPDPKVLKDRKDLPARKGNQVHREHKDQKATKGLLDHKDPLGR